MSARSARRARRSRRRGIARDQHESAFTAILDELVRRVPGAHGAALVDREGETVDFAGGGRAFDLQLAAAHWRLVLDLVHSQSSLASAASLAVRAERASYVVHQLPDGYAVVLVLARRAGFAGWRRALPACARALGVEAGWVEEPSRGGRARGGQPSAEAVSPWFAVEVAEDDRARPRRLRWRGEERPFEILGTQVSGLARSERAWRVRLESGLEATLLREPGGAWWLDELPTLEKKR